MKTAAITGATSGIGRALAEKLAAAGSGLVLVARREAALRAQQELLESRFAIPVEIVPCDLADREAVASLCARLLALPAVDILVNNVGFNEAGFFADPNLQREMDMLQVRVASLTMITKAVLPGMLRRHDGYILNVGSTGSFGPCPHDAVYAASKAYVLSLSNALHQELRHTGVSVTCLCPAPQILPSLTGPDWKVHHCSCAS